MINTEKTERKILDIVSVLRDINGAANVTGYSVMQIAKNTFVYVYAKSPYFGLTHIGYCDATSRNGL